MLIREMSDIHLEFSDWDYVIPKLETDRETVLVLAGDIALANSIENCYEFFNRCSEQFRAVVYICGNHEYYHSMVTEAIERIKEFIGQFHNVFFLNDSSIQIDDVNFIGGTLWTNFGGFDKAKMSMAKMYMNDFKTIRNIDYTMFDPLDAYQRHHETIGFFVDALYNSTSKYNVVVSHHGPSFQSITGEYVNHALNCAYVTDLELWLSDFGSHAPNLWFHGHIHSSADYNIVQTRVVCNPRGYHRVHAENAGFMPTLLLDTEADNFQFHG